MKALSAIALAVVGLVGCDSSSETYSSAEMAFIPAPCQVGVYGQAEPFVAITRRDSVFSYSLSDGRRGKIDNQALVECGEGTVRIEGLALLERRPLQITNAAVSGRC